MALEAKTDEYAGSRYWTYLNSDNSMCPMCGKEICSSDKGIEYSRTKRGTHIFFHEKCFKKAMSTK